MWDTFADSWMMCSGEVSKEDGIWKDDHGEEAKGVIGVDPGRFSWLKGFAGAVNRVRGTGDF